jgi:tellurite resistance protein
MSMSEDFFPEIEIRDDQAEAMARGLYVVARADGKIHEREAAMIGEFFNATNDHPSHLGTLERSAPITAAHLAAVLSTKDLRRLFVKTALLVAYADGEYAPAEQKVIGDFAKACEIDSKGLAALEQSVKDYMISHLAHLQNVQAVAQVSKSFKS